MRFKSNKAEKIRKGFKSPDGVSSLAPKTTGKNLKNNMNKIKQKKASKRAVVKK